MRRRHKYGNVHTVVAGERFASKREARRWEELLLLVKAGEIQSLKRQVRYELRAFDGSDDGKVIGHYVGDFEYFDNRTNEWRVEDAKGWRTQLYSWKKRHYEAQFGTTIHEV